MSEYQPLSTINELAVLDEGECRLRFGLEQVEQCLREDAAGLVQRAVRRIDGVRR